MALTGATMFVHSLCMTCAEMMSSSKGLISCKQSYVEVNPWMRCIDVDVGKWERCRLLNSVAVDAQTHTYFSYFYLNTSVAGSVVR